MLVLTERGVADADLKTTKKIVCNKKPERRRSGRTSQRLSSPVEKRKRFMGLVVVFDCLASVKKDDDGLFFSKSLFFDAAEVGRLLCLYLRGQSADQGLISAQQPLHLLHRHRATFSPALDTN